MSIEADTMRRYEVMRDPESDDGLYIEAPFQDAINLHHELDATLDGEPVTVRVTNIGMSLGDITRTPSAWGYAWGVEVIEPFDPSNPWLKKEAA